MGADLFHSALPWESPERSGEGRLPMRSPLLPYPSAESALAALRAGARRRDESADPWRLSLDGSWRFALADNPASVPELFAAPSFDDSGWGKLRVPGTWTLQGYDKPHYTNVVMPFGNVPPAPPASRNPTGLYRVGFTLPEGWERRRVILHVGGAESFLEAWCNGTRLGFSKDTRLPSEFDVTSCAKRGENLLSFMVVRYSDASFIEDQDQWWYGGIYRGVYLYTTDFAYLADVDARPALADDFGSGSVEVAVKLGFAFDPAADKVPAMTAPVDYQPSPGAGLPWDLDPGRYRGDWGVRLALYAPGSSLPLAKAEGKVGALYRASRWEARLSLPVAGPSLWSHESPALYSLVASLVSPRGEEVEHCACALGFRRVEVRDRALLVNGAAVLVKGVNRHEHDERTGKTLDVEDMVRDIEIMKRHNFNAVRLSHYPNDERWYELCDEYGLYLVDEANIESHAYYDHLCREPRYASAFLERGMRMVLRDKNHPSIIIWSLGNESGYGPNQDAMAGWIRSFDPSRPLHYEGALRPERGQGPHTLESIKRGSAASDIVSTMYPPISLLEAWAETTEDSRPFIMCEYSHAMGNSNGSLSDYWAVIESHKGLQGGFIWDWVDQGLEAFDAAGRKYWKYGGDFGDKPSDLDFICNGLVFPDRSEKPVLSECAKLFQPIALSSDHPLSGKITLRNRRDFSGTSDLRMRWTIQVEGEALLSGTRALPELAPGASAEIELDFAWTPEARSRVAAGESFLYLEILLAEDCPWAKAGHRVAWEQLALAPRSAASSLPAPAAGAKAAGAGAAGPAALLAPLAGGYRAASVVGARADARRGDEGRGDEAKNQASAYEASISESGFLSSLSFGAGELLAAPLGMSLWRAPTENDGLKLFMELRGIDDFKWYTDGKAMYAWLDAGLDELDFDLVGMKPDLGENALSIVHEVATKKGKRVGRFVQDWRFEAEGPDCSFFFDLDEGLPELPKIGLACALAPALEKVRWYGRGPQECYSDRKAGARVGLHESSVDGLQVPYVLPQENGNRTDVRWVELSDEARGARGLLVSTASSFDFTASHHGADQLWRARHTCDLVRKPETFLAIDVAQRGLGTATCGPDTLERYRLRPGPYRLALSLRGPRG